MPPFLALGVLQLPDSSRSFEPSGALETILQKQIELVVG